MRNNLNISLLITSALFVDEKGCILSEPVQTRVDRLIKSLEAMKVFGFKKTIIVDATIVGSHDILQIIEQQYEVNIYITTKNRHTENGEYLKYGPSRLEIDLLNSSSTFLKNEFSETDFVLKLSAGYEIKNLRKILKQTNYGIVYRFGNPFRTRIKFCLSCFYILPTNKFFDFCDYSRENIFEVTKLRPLEYYLYRFTKSIETKVIAIDYPIIDAKFMSSNQSSADLKYQSKQMVYDALSKIGLYAFEVR